MLTLGSRLGTLERLQLRLTLSSERCGHLALNVLLRAQQLGERGHLRQLLLGGCRLCTHSRLDGISWRR